MTPEDFVRSLTPGAKQPEGLGLDQFRRIDPKKFKRDGASTLPEDSIFFKLAENGLLTFSGWPAGTAVQMDNSRYGRIFLFCIYNALGKYRRFQLHC